MKTTSIYLIVLWLLMGCSHLDQNHVKWSGWDKTCGIFCLGGRTMDMVSTEYALNNPNNYELNPVLGKHPSDTKLAVYGAATTCFVLILADQVGKYSTKLRKTILIIGGALGFGCAVHNYNL